jgi:hypothetical protein
MLKNCWIEHLSIENAEKPVQNARKRSSQSDKVGRLNYNQQLLKQVLSEQVEIKLLLIREIQD